MFVSTYLRTQVTAGDDICTFARTHLGFRLCRCLQLSNSFINLITYCYRSAYVQRSAQEYVAHKKKKTQLNIKQRNTFPQSDGVVLSAFSNQM